MNGEKKELNYNGVAVVFDNPKRVIDKKREFLINAMILYADTAEREIKVVFFNGEERETGVSFFFKKGD